MNWHLIMVSVTGLLYLAAGGVLAETSRVLGPSFHTRHTPHPFWRFVGWVGAAVLIWRGATLLFPGGYVETARMSGQALFVALVVLGLTLSLLDWVMRDRNPPPWTSRLLGMALKGGASDAALAEMAFALPVEPHGRPATEQGPCRIARLGVMIGAGAVMAMIAIVIVIASAGG